jgi:hypothetical protein
MAGQEYWKQIYYLFNLLELLGFWTSAIVRYSKELERNQFWKLDQFLPSGDGGDTFLGPIERANLSHWTDCVQSQSQSYVMTDGQSVCLGIKRPSGA